MSNVAVSWTGGKDSSLALHEAEASGCRINCLVTFAPSNERLLAHPVAFMKLQAQALGLPHHVIEVKEPFEQNYENAILSLKEGRGIDALVTGDIGEVAGQSPEWMVGRGARCGVDVLGPCGTRTDLNFWMNCYHSDSKQFSHALRGLGSRRNGLDWNSPTVRWNVSAN